MDDRETDIKRNKIIVVERYPLARAALADLLVGDGYRVFQSDNAKSAISCVEQNKDVAAVLADLQVPGWKSLVGYTCASHSIVDPAELQRRGIKFWLVKPIVYEDIQRLLRFER
jgi:CheY-like chemotaxis protein